MTAMGMNATWNDAMTEMTPINLKIVGKKSVKP